MKPPADAPGGGSVDIDSDGSAVSRPGARPERRPPGQRVHPDAGAEPDSDVDSDAAVGRDAEGESAAAADPAWDPPSAAETSSLTGSAGDGGPHPNPAPSALIPAPRTEALPADTEAVETALDEDDTDAVDEAKEMAPRGATLTGREREILAFERRWWKHAGAKEQAIRDTFDLSATRYYQLLNALLDNPAALAAEPVLVARLRRLRSSRARSRRR